MSQTPACECLQIEGNALWTVDSHAQEASDLRPEGLRLVVCIFKLGGSLLDLPDLSHRLSAVMAQRSDRRILLVAGGGAAADLVRDWDHKHHLGNETAHWLAVRAMSLNEALLAQLLPQSRRVRNREEAAHAWQSGCCSILDTYEFLRDETAAGTMDLPHCWDVTSDSIAAGIAGIWPAQELILLKSTGLPKDCTVADATQAGLVDRWFPNVVSNVPRIGWGNLRDSEPMIHNWRVSRLSEKGDWLP